MILLKLFELILILNVILKRCDCKLINTKHKLGLGLIKDPFNLLCKKLDDPKITKRCNIVSCIGANKWNQRYFLEKNFGLDPTKSSTLSGPLNHRNDLWEDVVKDGYNLLLDSEIPNFNDIKTTVNGNSLVRLSSLSNYGEVSLAENVKTFFEKLSKRIDFELNGKEKNHKDIYIVLPDFNSFEKKVNVTGQMLKSLEKSLKDFFPENKVKVKKFNNKLNISKYFDSPLSSNVKEVVEVLRSFISPNYELNSSLDYLGNKCFQSLNKFVDDSLEKSLKGDNLNNFLSDYQTFVMHSSLTFSILSMEKLGHNFKFNLIDFADSYKSRMIINSIMYNLETEVKSEFAKYFAKHRNKIDINLTVDQFLHKFKTRAKNLLPETNENEFLRINKEVLDKLRYYMYHKYELYTKFPNNFDSEGERDPSKALKKKMKFKPRSDWFLQLAAFFRDEGSGNRSGFFSYMFPKLLVSLGYSNDRGLFDTGDGAVGPPLKVQPILHLRVKL